MTPRLEFRRLGHSFGERNLFEGLNLSLAPEEFLLVTGPNGSGKSTLLRIAATLLRPKEGEVRIGGCPSGGREMRRQIGAIFHQPMVYSHLTGREYLHFVASIYRTQKGVEEILSRVELTRSADQRIEHYSNGMAQRLNLARILLQEPSLLLFDEPCSGLDASGIASQREVLEDFLQKGAAVVIATHRADLYDGLASRRLHLSS
ncbi:MAG: heme ABC exporter ATP-binding protein CcmA [Deltaproteobacteria bacterium]|nr:heme ABC exporter ATP-binding protein CcmA [Deltaproteobacteria bacterium]